jgi:hypothetical protein
MPSSPPPFVVTRNNEARVTTALRAAILVQMSVAAPGSDRWHQIKQYRESLYSLISDKWHELMRVQPGELIFPFSEDYIIHRLYTDYRKTSVEIDHNLTDYLGLPRNEKKGSGRKQKLENINAIS